MQNQQINIRDPFVVCENGMYYLYGTRAQDFGCSTGGFDVYTGTDLENWSQPFAVFDSQAYGLNRSVNWAPEVHRYGGRYYMFATFEQPNGNRGTYALVSDALTGPFVPHSEGALTPPDWISLDGTLWVEGGKPYLVFCHEHVQIRNGTVCCVELSADLRTAVGGPVLLFHGADAYGVPESRDGRYVTDGPFLYRGREGALFMIWSTCPPDGYYQGICKSETGRVEGPWRQLPPLFTKDGGHGMLFRDLAGNLRLTLHSPNISLWERPVFFRVSEEDGTLRIAEDAG